MADYQRNLFPSMRLKFIGSNLYNYHLPISFLNYADFDFKGHLKKTFKKAEKLNKTRKNYIDQKRNKAELKNWTNLFF